MVAAPHPKPLPLNSLAGSNAWFQTQRHFALRSLRCGRRTTSKTTHLTLPGGVKRLVANSASSSFFNFPFLLLIFSPLPFHLPFIPSFILFLFPFFFFPSFFLITFSLHFFLFLFLSFSFFLPYFSFCFSFFPFPYPFASPFFVPFLLLISFSCSSTVVRRPPSLSPVIVVLPLRRSGSRGWSG